MTTGIPHAAFKALTASSNDTTAADHNAAIVITHLNTSINKLAEELISTRLTMIQNEKQLKRVLDHLKLEQNPSL